MKNLRMLRWCNGEHYIATVQCPWSGWSRHGYLDYSPVEQRLGTPEGSSYESLIAAGVLENLLLRVLLADPWVLEAPDPMVVPCGGVAQPWLADAVQARNRVLLRHFPGGILARALASPPARVSLPYYRRREDPASEWQLLDLGADAHEAAAVLADESVAVRAFLVHAGRAPQKISEDDTLDLEAELQRRRYPLVPEGHLIFAQFG